MTGVGRWTDDDAAATGLSRRGFVAGLSAAGGWAPGTAWVLAYWNLLSLPL